jgi:hypothetical protein
MQTKQKYRDPNQGGLAKYLAHLGLLMTASLSFVLASVLFASSAQAIDTNFEYQINPRHNFGKCVDVAGSSQNNSAAVIQFSCTSNPNQRFRFSRVSGNIYTIRAVHSGKCLDVAGSSQSNSAPVIQFSCGNTVNQRFQLLDDKNQAGLASRIRAVHSGKCLDIPGSSNADSVRVVQFTCHGGNNQLFDITAFAP